MRGGREGWLWIGLLAAFSPVLGDLLQHQWQEPWARYAWLFPPLLVQALMRATPVAPRSDGWLWLAAALLGMLFCVAGNTTRVARPLMVLAILGLCRATGRADLRTALLAAWIVPVPHGLLLRAGPAPMLLGALPLFPPDGGLPLVALLSGLGWWAALGRGASWLRAASRALGWGLAALPAQAAALGLAWAVAAAGAPGAARSGLSYALWPAAAAAGLALARRRRGGGSGER